MKTFLLILSILLLFSCAKTDEERKAEIKKEITLQAEAKRELAEEAARAWNSKNDLFEQNIAAEIPVEGLLRKSLR